LRGSRFCRLQEGLKGIYLLFDRESGRSLSITLWETEKDMRASEEAAGETVIGVPRCEVALQELNL
jgi:heme-degrading monooxygenase HmoA